MGTSRGLNPGFVPSLQSCQYQELRPMGFRTFLYFYTMRKITYSILVLSLFGCKNFETEKLSHEEVLRQKLEHFNWKEVDTYPSFSSCDGIFEKTAAKQCFETKLAEYFLSSFSDTQLIASDSINATAYLYFGISKTGEPLIDSMKIPPVLQEQFPEMEIRFRQSLTDLPKIHPAQKRGIPVSVKFTLPIRIVSQ